MKKDLFNTRSEIAEKYIPVMKQELRSKMEDGGGVEKSKEPKKLFSKDLSPEEMQMLAAGPTGLAMIAAKRKMAQKQYKKEQVENYKAKHGGKEEWEVEAAKWKYKKGGSVQSSLGAEYFVGDSCLVAIGRGKKYRKVKIQNITDKWVYYSYEAGTKKTYLSVRDFEKKVSGKANESDEVDETPDKLTVAAATGNTIIAGNLEVEPVDFPEKMNLGDATIRLKNLGDGWRLPTKDELNKLFKEKDSIGGFSNDFYLSSTEVPNYPALSYIQNFGDDGALRATEGHKNNLYKFRAVRDIAAPEGKEGQVRLKRGEPVKNMAARKSPKLIIDNLEVYPNDLPEVMNWYDAVKACNNLGQGWRLPTKEELNKLFEENKISMKFLNFVYWSSTENGDYAWLQYFFSGNQYQSTKKKAEHKVRPVRDIVAPEVKEVTKSTENIAEPKPEIAKDTQKSFLGWVYQNMASSTELDNAMLAKKILSDFGANMKSTGNTNAGMILKIINEIPDKTKP